MSATKKTTTHADKPGAPFHDALFRLGGRKGRKVCGPLEANPVGWRTQV